MWGFGGRHYWGRKERGKAEGIVVVFAWMSSQDRHLKNYVDLYSSLGWDSLVCHSQFLNSFFPEKAAVLALEIVNELVEELKVRPCPVVFVSFSGGPKSCMYKVLQIIDGKCEEQFNLGEYRLVRDCVAGHIFDSSPVDFTSDLGTRFVLHPTILKMSRPPPLVSWIANGIASSLDALFLSRFEAQRADYWQTLYASTSMGAPYLILCSEDDDLAPYETIRNFAKRLKDLGGDVKLVTWSSSSHVVPVHNYFLNLLKHKESISPPLRLEPTTSHMEEQLGATRPQGHYRRYPIEYKAAVAETFLKASSIYSQRTRQLGGEKMGLEETHGGETSDQLSSLRNGASTSNQSFHRAALDLNDHFFIPGSVEYHEGRNLGSVPDEGKEHFIPAISSLPRINAHGVLGQILFDVCVPKNVEGWDIRLSPSFSRGSLAPGRRQSPLNPIKCIRRSRL